MFLAIEVKGLLVDLDELGIERVGVGVGGPREENVVREHAAPG